MPGLVTSGALLRCSLGSAPSTLLVTASGRATAGGNPVATIADNTAMQNIRPFGVCASSINPAASPSARPACVPIIATPWSPGSPSVRTGNLPVLNSACQCHCQWGGVVTVVSPGQQSTTVA
jgi:hypothetical protein